MTELEWRRYAIDDETVAAIEAMRPILEETEEQADRERVMPDAAVSAIRASGVWKTGSPKVLGGWEADPVLEYEITEAISRISTAAGWTAFIGSFHTSLPAAYLGDEAIKAMFGGSEWPVVAGNFAPMGSAEIVDGGVRVSGHYGFASGINHADWVAGGCVDVDADLASEDMLDANLDGPPKMLVWVAPKDENITLLDNWFVSGMAGSGSFDYEVKDMFVPDGYWFRWPFPEVKRGGDRYLAPLPLQPLTVHTALAMGGAERAIEIIAATAASKKRLTSTNTIADRGAFQRDLGHAFLRLSAARAYIVGLLDQLGSVPWPEQPNPEAFAAEFQGAGAYVTEVATSVIEFAYKYAGASAIRLDNPLQRILRDVQAAQQHVLVADTSYDALGEWAITRTPTTEGETAEAVAAG